MVVAMARIHLRIEGAQSLKDKRQVLRSLMDKARKFGISVAEVEDHDLWNRATIGLACVSNQLAHAQSVMQNALNLFEESPAAVAEGVEMEMVRMSGE